MSSGATPPTGAPAPSPSPAPAAGGKAAGSPAPGATPGSSAGATTTTTKKKTTKKKAAGGAGGTDKTKKPTKKRKTASKSSGTAASNAAMAAAAKAATADLALQRAQAAARKTDPLWYRIEDVLPPASTKAEAQQQHEHTMASSSSSILPEQVQIVESALKFNNMTRSDVTPQAMACLLEQARRYATELQEDAQDYAAHAAGLFVPAPGGKGGATVPNGPLPEPSPKDFSLAAEMRPDHPTAVTAQLPKLMLLAQKVNAVPLPPIPPHCYNGILLPPAPHALTSRTFDVVTGSHVAQKMIQAPPGPPKAFASSMAAAGQLEKASSASSTTTKKSSKTGYGATRGPQIPVKLKAADAAAADGTSTPKPPAATSSSSTGPTPMDTSKS
ncbi:expressed unknown protein [Seminavis robusta]|uniref:Uncharacterized protein n=1 Tax=Seminavis robusta TaxID=568900 RepID=A0A9N8EXA8_9STRA|nr:expressed unknown protein [Seminavis robusta]|eukprot:Sro2653_g333760.1 n/a (386) ;mRNA; f:4824-5981